MYTKYKRLNKGVRQMMPKSVRLSCYDSLTALAVHHVMYAFLCLEDVICNVRDRSEYHPVVLYRE